MEPQLGHLFTGFEDKIVGHPIAFDRRRSGLGAAGQGYRQGEEESKHTESLSEGIRQKPEGKAWADCSLLTMEFGFPPAANRRPPGRPSGFWASVFCLQAAGL